MTKHDDTKTEVLNKSWRVRPSENGIEFVVPSGYSTEVFEVTPAQLDAMKNEHARYKQQMREVANANPHAWHVKHDENGRGGR